MPWSENMRFLGENEFGFSPSALGFPSISGCRAVVYQNANGLFGFHQASGAHSDKFARFGAKFATFVRDHAMGGGAGTSFYIAAKQTAGGSYSMGAKGMQEHLSEVQAFTSALGFKGTARSYNLSARWAHVGVYVEVTATGGVCKMQGNAWVEHHNPDHKGPVPALERANHLHSYPPKDNFTVPNAVFIKVDTTNQQTLEPDIIAQV
jgi:hypothetical protein